MEIALISMVIPFFFRQIQTFTYFQSSGGNLKIAHANKTVNGKLYSPIFLRTIICKLGTWQLAVGKMCKDQNWYSAPNRQNLNIPQVKFAQK